VPDPRDQRDRRRLITPPAGVRAQSAPQTWEDHDSHTPPLAPGATADPSETLDRIGRRVKNTARTSQTAVDLIGALRWEFDAKVTHLTGKLDALTAEVADVGRTGARNEGKLDGISGQLEDDRAERRQRAEMTVTAFHADLELGKTRALSQIGVDHDSATAAITERRLVGEYRRALVFKLVAGIGAAWAVISTIALARCS